MIAAAASTVTLDANTIILAVISLIGTCVTGFLALRMATVAADSKENKAANIKAADGIEKIHVAVNSERSAMIAKVDQLTKHIEALTKTVATLEENKRGSELAKAVASVPPVFVTPTATATPAHAGATTPLKEAIADLTEAAKDTAVAADKTVEMVVKVPHK